MQVFVTFPNWDSLVAEPMRKAGGNANYVVFAFFALMASQLVHTVRACIRLGSAHLLALACVCAAQRPGAVAVGSGPPLLFF